MSYKKETLFLLHLGRFNQCLRLNIYRALSKGNITMLCDERENRFVSYLKGNLYDYERIEDSTMKKLDFEV